MKELIGLGSFLIYLGIAVAGYFALREQVTQTAEDFKLIQKDVIVINRALDIIQLRQTESIEKLNSVSNKLDDVDHKIDKIGYDITTLISKR